MRAIVVGYSVCTDLPAVDACYCCWLFGVYWLTGCWCVLLLLAIQCVLIYRLLMRAIVVGYSVCTDLPAVDACYCCWLFGVYWFTGCWCVLLLLAIRCVLTYRLLMRAIVVGYSVCTDLPAVDACYCCWLFGVYWFTGCAHISFNWSAHCRNVCCVSLWYLTGYIITSVIAFRPIILHIIKVIFFVFFKYFLHWVLMCI